MYYKTTTKLNYRTGPGKSYTCAGTLKKGALIKMQDRKKGWVKFKKNGKFYYCSSAYLTKAIDYGNVVASLVAPMAKEVVKNKAKHVSGAYCFSGHKVNCSVFVSACLQKAKLLSKKTTVYHTSKEHSKSSLKDVVVNRTSVKHYSWVKTSCSYPHLPKKYKKPGCVYVYPSSIGILGSDKHIYGCHSSGKTYTKMSMIKHNAGDYEYTSNILAVGIPRIE